MQVSVRTALQLPPGSANAFLRDAFKSDPEVFFQAGLELLQSAPPNSEQARMSPGLLDRPEFLLELIRPGRFSVRDLTRICRKLHAIDHRLDLRLAKLLPGRWEDRYALTPEVIVRILGVLNEISSGPRLIPILIHLTGHNDPAVAERATTLVGKRIRNWGWTQRWLESGGPEIRAGVVEGLWGVDTPQARHTMRKCLEDASERVVGRAVYGLHLLREDDVLPLVRRMAEDARPAFRATAAWLAGQIDEPGYAGLLEHARRDSSPVVRLAAKEAMAVRRQTAALKESEARALESAKPKPAPEAVPTPPEPPAPKRRKRELHLRLDGTSTVTRWDESRY